MWLILQGEFILKKNSSKSLWIILAVIIALIAALSLGNCLDKEKQIKTSEFTRLVELQTGDKTISKEELKQISNVNYPNYHSNATSR